MSAPMRRLLLRNTQRLISAKYDQGTRFLSSDNNKFPKYADYEVSKEDFKYVEKILPPDTIPEPPKATSRTPSGWVSQTANPEEKEYWIKRTKNHMLPVYLQLKNHGSEHYTSIRYIEGDIWAFDKEMRTWLEDKTHKKMTSQVHEVSRSVRLRGNYVQEVGDFLVDQGL